MTELLDTQVAARIVAECRDRDPVQRLQRATYIAETLLEGLGLRHTMLTIRRIRAGLPTIIDVVPDPPPEQPEPALLPWASLRPSLTSEP